MKYFTKERSVKMETLKKHTNTKSDKLTEPKLVLIF